MLFRVVPEPEQGRVLLTVRLERNGKGMLVEAQSELHPGDRVAGWTYEQLVRGEASAIEID